MIFRNNVNIELNNPIDNKLIFNLNGLHISEIRTITLSVTLSMIVVNTARTK